MILMQSNRCNLEVCSAQDDDAQGDQTIDHLSFSPSRRTARVSPAYVKHGLPDILPQRIDYQNFLPKIPGADDNYGMLYNKPESEAEKTMHELWMARRRQEVQVF